MAEVHGLGPLSDGLDRDRLGEYTLIEKTDKNGPGELSSNDASEAKTPKQNSQSRHFKSIRRLSSQVRSKLHRKLHEGPRLPNDQRRADHTNLAPTLAPTPAAEVEDGRFGEGPPDKPDLPPLKEFIFSPIATAKTVAHVRGGDDFAENVAKQDISHGTNVHFVRAYDKYVDSKNEEERSSALEDLEELKHTRQDSFVRWTLDRHVRIVGRVNAHELHRRERSKFMRDDPHGKKTTAWTDYGKHVRVLPYAPSARATWLSGVLLRPSCSNTDPGLSWRNTMSTTMAATTSAQPRIYQSRQRVLSLRASKG